jgi:LPXTG-motif cell wall-anchored protein
VPINLPEGWDADAFLGEHRDHGMQHAASPMPAGTQLALAKAPEAAVAPQDSGVVLPQTATDSRLLFALGLVFVIAGGLMLRRRIASEGNR